MTGKRSPLDFIINDSTARSDKQKAREYAATRTAACNEHEGRSLEARMRSKARAAATQGIHLSLSFSVTKGEELKRLALRPETGRKSSSLHVTHRIWQSLQQERKKQEREKKRGREYSHRTNSVAFWSDSN